MKLTDYRAQIFIKEVIRTFKKKMISICCNKAEEIVRMRIIWLILKSDEGRRIFSRNTIYITK